MKTINLLLKQMSSVDDPIKFLRNYDIKITLVGQSKITGGDAYLIDNKLGELKFSFDKYGRKVYSFLPIKKSMVIENA